MKNCKKILRLNGRQLNGTYYPKINRVLQEPRHKIRQLLRSFTLPKSFKRVTETDPKVKT